MLLWMANVLLYERDLIDSRQLWGPTLMVFKYYIKLLEIMGHFLGRPKGFCLEGGKSFVDKATANITRPAKDLWPTFASLFIYETSKKLRNMDYYYSKSPMI